MGKRIMVYDATEQKRNFFLSASWWWGAKLYMAKGDIDECKGIHSLEEMLRFIVDLDEQIDEVQFWGHGWYGNFIIDRKWHSVGTLLPEDRHGESSVVYPLLIELRNRFVGDDSLLWFRTCSTFGGVSGHAFAEEWAEFLRCRVAGHTHIIGPWQSGLHSLGVDESPSWSTKEGSTGSPSKPKGIMSAPWSPNTIFCTQGEIPNGW